MKTEFIDSRDGDTALEVLFRRWRDGRRAAASHALTNPAASDHGQGTVYNQLANDGPQRIIADFLLNFSKVRAALSKSPLDIMFPNAASQYMDSLIFLFLGGFLIAIAVEKWNLHKRIALHILALIGGQPQRLVLGFMVATGFLSMWLSNTATTMMMMPMGLSLIVLYE